MADTQIFYKDLSLDLIANPISGDIRPITNETAVRRSLINTLRTKKGERPFYYQFGSQLQKYLFEPATPLTEYQINREVNETIQRFEPRVVVNSVESKIDTDGITVKVSYTIINTGTQDSIELLVSRE